MQTTTKIEITAIGDDELATVRRTGEDVSGNPAVAVTAEGGEPLRCCLRNGRAGESLLLFGYAPAIPEGPYREVGPVFAHAEPCGGPASGDYPVEWLTRSQVLRAYDARGWIHPATRAHDGTDPAAVLQDVLAVPGVVQVHSRNIEYGCYMFRATATAPQG